MTIREMCVIMYFHRHFTWTLWR